MYRATLDHLRPRMTAPRLAAAPASDSLLTIVLFLSFLLLLAALALKLSSLSYPPTELNTKRAHDAPLAAAAVDKRHPRAALPDLQAPHAVAPPRAPSLIASFSSMLASVTRPVPVPDPAAVIDRALDATPAAATVVPKLEKAESPWPVKQPYDAFLVLDVEATCQEGTDFNWPNEIIVSAQRDWAVRPAVTYD